MHLLYALDSLRAAHDGLDANTAHGHAAAKILQTILHVSEVVDDLAAASNHTKRLQERR